MLNFVLFFLLLDLTLDWEWWHSSGVSLCLIISVHSTQTTASSGALLPCTLPLMALCKEKGKQPLRVTLTLTLLHPTASYPLPERTHYRANSQFRKTLLRVNVEDRHCEWKAWLHWQYCAQMCLGSLARTAACHFAISSSALSPLSLLLPIAKYTRTLPGHLVLRFLCTAAMGSGW